MSHVLKLYFNQTHKNKVDINLLVGRLLIQDKRSAELYHIQSLKLIGMEVRAKNILIAKNYISKMSFNNRHSILACVVQGNDTIAFFFVSADFLIYQILGNQSKPSGKKTSLSWSCDGTFLALGSSTLQLWKLHQKKLIPLKTFNDDFIDIKLICWSPDSTTVAYGGLSKKNAVKIRNLQTNFVHQILLPLTVSSISFDPFGKYLLLLIRNNVLLVYSSTSLTKIREVNLSPKANSLENINTVKEIRQMGWSPDFNELVCPSLDDSKIAIALRLSRNNNFGVRNIYFGHVSSISCAQFNPKLYDFQGQITTILALGDSHGVISIWRVAQKKKYLEPLFISNVMDNSFEVIEDLQWNESGDLLMANMLKRYIHLLKFSKQNFGRQISIQEKNVLIEEAYGVKNASQISKRQFQIFSFHEMKADLQNPRASASQIVEAISSSMEPIASLMSRQPAPLPAQHSFQNDDNKVQFIRIQQQKTTTDKNNRKRIQPAVLVRKDEVEKMNHHLDNLKINHIQYVEPLKLTPIQTDLKFFKLSRDRTIEFKRLQGFTIVQLFQIGDKALIYQRIFPAAIDHIVAKSKKIYILNQGNLYVFDFNFNLIELPLAFGEVHKISINHLGDIFYLSTKGLIYGFNHIDMKCYTPSPLPIQILIENIKKLNFQDSKLKNALEMIPEKEYNEKLIEEFTVENDHNIYVSLSISKNKYFYQKGIGSWVSLQLNSGLIKEGYSLKVTQNEQKNIKDYFNSISMKNAQNKKSPMFNLGNQNKKSSQFLTYESNMIYYKKHNPNKELYEQNLLNLIKEMKEKGQVNKLRTLINKYFIEKDSQLYQSNPLLLQKVKAIGGNVIQEFVLFNKI